MYVFVVFLCPTVVDVLHQEKVHGEELVSPRTVNQLFFSYTYRSFSALFCIYSLFAVLSLSFAHSILLSLLVLCVMAMYWVLLLLHCCCLLQETGTKILKKL